MRNSGIQNKLREGCFKRDKFTCVKCGLNGKKGWYEVYGGISINLIADHIIPKALDGKDILKNMQTLCLKCNRIKNAKDQGDIAKSKREAKNGGGEITTNRDY